jgi:hypothetical protein
MTPAITPDHALCGSPSTSHRRNTLTPALDTQHPADYRWGSPVNGLQRTPNPDIRATSAKTDHRTTIQAKTLRLTLCAQIVSHVDCR